MNDEISFKLQKVLSYNCFLNIIIGERGVGKSYELKRYSANKFIKKNKKFAYIRRYKTELSKALKKGSEPIFFNEISTRPEFKEHKFTNSNDTFYIDGKICGYAIPLSTSNILKSSQFNDVDTIIFDEFQVMKGVYHYLNNEVENFLELIETINRLRPNVKIFMLSNAISITSPYFTFFNLTLPYNSDIKTFKNNTILVHYIKNIEYRKLKKQSSFGKLVDGTKYGEYAIDNKFLQDNNCFIMKKSKNSKLFFTLKIDTHFYGVWKDFQNECIFISSKTNINYPIKLALTNESHDNNTIYIKSKVNVFFKSLQNHYECGKLYFENQSIKNMVCNCLSKYLT